MRWVGKGNALASPRVRCPDKSEKKRLTVVLVG